MKRGRGRGDEGMRRKMRMEVRAKASETCTGAQFSMQHARSETIGNRQRKEIIKQLKQNNNRVIPFRSSVYLAATRSAPSSSQSSSEPT